MYPSLDSTGRSAPHDATLPIPAPTGDALNSAQDTSDNSEVESFAEDAFELDPNFMCQDDNYAPQLLTQEDLNDLVRDLALSKEKA